MVRTQQEIIDAIRYIAPHAHVKRVWLFGSVARNEHNENSDVDILIEKDDGFSGKDSSLIYELTRRLSGKDFNNIEEYHRLDELIDESNPHYDKEMYDNIHRDKILVYDKESE